MKTIPSWRKHHYVARASIFLGLLALIVGIVACTSTEGHYYSDLTVTTTAGGSVAAPGEGTLLYDEGTVVSLVAEADEGYHFVNWTGDVGTVANVNAATTTVTMDGDYSVTANFMEYTANFGGWMLEEGICNLTTSSTAGGNVTTPGQGTFAYDEGTVVDLVATPGAGYRFVNWTGDVSTIGNVTGASTTITMNGDYSITADFVALYNLTISSTAGGNVTTPGQGTFTYDTGTVVNLVATPSAMVAAGERWTVGLKSDGTVVAVGGNDYGQCNVGGWTGITQVAAGFYHTVGLCSNGTVVAVGRNNVGQCNVGGWTGITQVAAGDYHTVGVKSDGTVVAVGHGSFGQCDVSSWTDIVQIAGGGYHTVGLKSDGTVVAVGMNEKGQCNVGGWTNIIQVAAGYQHTVGLKSDGTVVAVGDNYDGQCNVGGWTGIIQIDAGGYHTIGLKSDGTVVGTGYNGNGQCNVGGWTGIIQVNAGFYHTVALKSDGNVVAVGWSSHGELNVGSWRLFAHRFVNWTGNVGTIGNVTSASTNITMNGDYSITANFVKIYGLTTSSTAGGNVTTPGQGTFAYDTGTVVDLVATPDVGYRFVNWTGDVGTIGNVNAATTNITVNGDYSITANFVKVYDLTTSSTEGGSVTTPGEGTFTYDAGTVVSLNATPDAGYRFVNWTGNVGTIGNVTAASTTIPMNGDYSITANFVKIYDLITSSTAGGNVTTPGEGIFTYDEGTVVNLVATQDTADYLPMVAAGRGFTVGLKSDGTVVAVGDNSYGQCNVGNWTDIVQVSAGENHAVGLRSDGTVVAVGDNSYGQCNVGGWTGIVQIDASSAHTVGLKSDGTVVAVGNNQGGQCGVGGWGNITQVDAGRFHTVGLKADGTVVAVGDNSYGQCNVGNWTDIVQVAARAFHTAGLKSDGTVVCVGCNDAGQCNVGDWTDIIQISAGWCHVVGLKSDGTVVCVGCGGGECNVGGWMGIVKVSGGDWFTVGLKDDSTVVAVGRNDYGQCNVGDWMLLFAYGFVNWTGDVGTVADVNCAVTNITMNGDYSITANFTTIYRFDLALKSGWNMISLPLESCTGETDPGVILPDVEVIYAWNSETTSFDSPSEIVPGEGYWVLVFEDVTETIYGTPVEEYQLSSSYEGWHMIGSLYVDGQVNVGSGSVYGSLYHWNPETLSYVARPLDDARPGEGYWLLAFTDFSISVVPRPPAP